MVAIWAVWYNFLRIHTTLRVTPAMASGLSETVMAWADIVGAMDQPAKKRGPYKKTATAYPKPCIKQEYTVEITKYIPKPPRFPRIRFHAVSRGRFVPILPLSDGQSFRRSRNILPLASTADVAMTITTGACFMPCQDPHAGDAKKSRIERYTRSVAHYCGRPG